MIKDELKEIEFWESEYLKQIYYLLKIDKEKMLSGFETKEDIREDWEEFLGKSTSDFSTGSERIFYWLFNHFGVPNSSPIGSDMFFETYNAYVHIDIKTTNTKNIGDFANVISVEDNQNSYIGTIKLKDEDRSYKGNLPTFYHKNDGTEKLCLTYFISILYNEDNLHIEAIIISCMPNGELNDIYEPNVLRAGKLKGKIRYQHTKCKYFKLLPNDIDGTKQLRTRVLIWNPEDDNIKKRLKNLEEIFEEQKKKEKLDKNNDFHVKF